MPAPLQTGQHTPEQPQRPTGTGMEKNVLDPLLSGQRRLQSDPQGRFAAVPGGGTLFGRARQPSQRQRQRQRQRQQRRVRKARQGFPHVDERQGRKERLEAVLRHQRDDRVHQQPPGRGHPPALANPNREAGGHPADPEPGHGPTRILYQQARGLPQGEEATAGGTLESEPGCLSGRQPQGVDGRHKVLEGSNSGSNSGSNGNSKGTILVLVDATTTTTALLPGRIVRSLRRHRDHRFGAGNRYGTAAIRFAEWQDY
mmetsp:Transcript_13877/g.29202  ORF Transcript_13877/g.29202 Transcript_13877/m.29202 type:complete len:257 (+) Transcript_13877:684-1454(+)